jgi:hypothetical protein
MIILIGKHQFTVSSIDDGGAVTNESQTTHGSRRVAANSSLRKSGIDSDALISLVENAEKILSGISKPDSEFKNKEDLSARLVTKNKRTEFSLLTFSLHRLKSLTEELSSHLNLGEDSAISDEKHYQDAKNAFQCQNLGETLAQGLGGAKGIAAAEDKSESRETNGATGKQQAKGGANLETIPENKSDCMDDDAKDEGADPVNNHHGHHNYATRRCTITCCAPDGSPLQGKSFIIDRTGATIGRKHTNAIALFMKIIDSSGEERIANVDTAISSEHARVEFEDKSGKIC